MIDITDRNVSELPLDQIGRQAQKFVIAIEPMETSMFNHQTKTMMTSVLAALPLVLGAAGQAAASAPAFTFANAEYMDHGAGLASARAFVASQLPNGTPISRARRRLARSDMDCRLASGSDGSLSCQYMMLAGADGGDIGEDVWTVHLASDGQGNVKAAKVGFQRYGMRP